MGIDAYIMTQFHTWLACSAQNSITLTRFVCSQNLTETRSCCGYLSPRMEDTQQNPTNHASSTRRNRSSRAKKGASVNGEDGHAGLQNGGGGDGGHILGNFPRYYDFHPAARLQPLFECPEALDAIFVTDVQTRRAFVMADFGCNDGTLTLLLAQELRAELGRRLLAGQEGKAGDAAAASPEETPSSSALTGEQDHGVRLGVLGVDIDEALLQRARDTAAGIAQPSVEAPQSDAPGESTLGPSDQPPQGGMGKMGDAAEESKPPPFDPSKQCVGPVRNAVVRFCAADLGAEDDPLVPILDGFSGAFHASNTPSTSKAAVEEWKGQGEGRAPDKGQGQRFDLVTIFSTTMWVHLNHGDEGLQRFLRRAASRASCLLIEPQEWSSYKSAQRRLKRLGLSESPHYQTISRRETPTQVLMRVLCQEGGMQVKSLGKTSAWKRDLLLFYG